MNEDDYLSALFIAQLIVFLTLAVVGISVYIWW